MYMHESYSNQPKLTRDARDRYGDRDRERDTERKTFKISFFGSTPLEYALIFVVTNCTRAHWSLASALSPRESLFRDMDRQVRLEHLTPEAVAEQERQREREKTISHSNLTTERSYEGLSTEAGLRPERERAFENEDTRMFLHRLTASGLRACVSCLACVRVSCRQRERRRERRAPLAREKFDADDEEISPRFCSSRSSFAVSS